MFILLSCLFDKKFTSEDSFCKILIEAQPAYVSWMFLKFKDFQ